MSTEKSKWKAEDFANAQEARLRAPMNYNDEAVVLFELVHVGVVVQTRTRFDSAAFVACIGSLRAIGWPIELISSPTELYASWRDDVPVEVLAAWRATYGTRLLSDLAGGTWQKTKEDMQKRAELRRYS